MTEAIQNWKRAAQEFERIDKLTAKQEYQNIKKALEQNLNHATYCRMTKPCKDKIIRRSKHRENYYAVCSFTGTCNMQTTDKKLARRAWRIPQK